MAYDPVKAHEYYVNYRKQGRKKGRKKAMPENAGSAARLKLQLEGLQQGFRALPPGKKGEAVEAIREILVKLKKAKGNG